MSKDEIFAQIQKEMSTMFELDESSIRADSRVFEDLELDSIDAIDLVAKLQSITGRRMAPDAMQKVRTVGDIVDLVGAELQASATL